MKHRLKEKKSFQTLAEPERFLFIVHIELEYQDLVNKKGNQLVLNNFV